MNEMPSNISIQDILLGVEATRAPFVPPVAYVPRTQKAKGVQLLREYGLLGFDADIYPIESVHPNDLQQKFVRPCPMLPRHGFVDSRYIDTYEDAVTIIAETKAADDQAEIITMPKIACDHSGIWTPGLLTIGPGNDGATTGRNTLNLPTAGTYDGISNVLKKRAGITDSPYVEFLYADYRRPVVQVRNGPEIPLTVDYIPNEITVKEIVRAEDHPDLLEWESFMNARKGADGLVVSHLGGSLASHYSVHAVLNGIPVVVSRKVKVGEVLSPTVEDRDFSIDELRAGFYYAQYARWNKEQLARVMLTALHHTALWKGKHDVLIGMGIGAAYRLTVLAALGEFRHNARLNHKKNNFQKDRNTVYNCYLSRSMQGITEERMALALKSFGGGAAAGWTGGYGGVKWYEFAKYAPLIHNALLEGNAKAALENFNQCVHAAHNNGWAFNKFVGDHEMTMAASNPTWALVQVANLLYVAEREIQIPNMLRRFMKRQPQRVPEKTWGKSPKPKAIKTVAVKTHEDAKWSPVHLCAQGSIAHFQYKAGEGKEYATFNVPYNYLNGEAIAFIEGTDSHSGTSFSGSASVYGKIGNSIMADGNIVFKGITLAVYDEDYNDKQEEEDCCSECENYGSECICVEEETVKPFVTWQELKEIPNPDYSWAGGQVIGLCGPGNTIHDGDLFKWGGKKVLTQCNVLTCACHCEYLGLKDFLKLPIPAEFSAFSAKSIEEWCSPGGVHKGDKFKYCPGLASCITLCNSFNCSCHEGKDY
jgi:hypothetical protein